MAKIPKSEAISQLKALIKKRRLIVLAGAGVSVESQLPTWEQLLASLVRMCRTLYVKDSFKDEYIRILDDAERHITRDPVRVASVLKQTIKKVIKGNTVAAGKYKYWLATSFSHAVPNKKHELIIQTDFPFILTTNYDILFEEAAYANNFAELATSTFTFKQGGALASAIANREPSIVHIHGVVSDLESGEVIFTQQDYRDMIKSKYEGFSFALRMLFFDYSVLYIGYGASDPHLEDITQDLTAYFPNDAEDFKFNKSFIILKEDKIDQVLVEYKRNLRADLIPIKDYSEIDEILEILKQEAPRKRISAKTGDDGEPQQELPGV